MAQHTATDYFKRTIQHYLEGRAQEDELFRPRYENPKKNIDECCDYILDSVYKSGRNGFADDEIYALALHYYDEDDIEVAVHRECRVIVNHTIELTEEEKAEARREAMRRATQEAYAQLTKHPQTKLRCSFKMLTSYRNHIGNATNDRVKTSDVGVIMAARKRMIVMACFL